MTEFIARQPDLWSEDIGVPQWHHEVLAAREADLRDGKEQFSDWESAKETIRELVK